MKNYPEESRAWDIAERVIMWTVAVLSCVCVYFAAYFARNIIWG